MGTCISERLSALRAQMEEAGADACLVPTADCHGSEYVAAHFRCREYLTGFTGSAGTLLVLKDRADLWTDGRYFLQAEAQLAGSGIGLMRAGLPETPSIECFLEQQLPPGSVFAADGRTLGAKEWSKLTDPLQTRGVRTRMDLDLPGRIWPDRPPLPMSPIWALAPEFSGESAAEKLQGLRETMREKDASACVLSNCEDIAWLLNIRGGDLPCTPVPLCYCMVTANALTLFAECSRIAPDARHALEAVNCAAEDYGGIYEAAGRIAPGVRVLADEKRLNASLRARIAAVAEVVDCPDLIALRRSVKKSGGDGEPAGRPREGGAALTAFMYRLKHPDGETDELGAAAWLDGARRAQEGFVDLSFGTICGYGEHAAIVHYLPTADSSIPLGRRGLLLVDSGGQYLQGTTDVTRTYALGSVTEEERLHYTLVLRGMLALMRVRFPEGTTGGQLDALARAPIWAHGLDFRHGTGHGIGYLLGVHEDPVRISPKADVVLRAGMVVSDEPGLYVSHKHGVRLENQLLCVPDETTEYGKFLRFETLTLSPVDLDAADVSLLSAEERETLNAYHARVYQTLAPRFTGEILRWLEEVTQPV